MTMDNMKDLLGKYSPKEPPEVIAIKQYISTEFQATPSITVQEMSIVITVQSASLANALRLRTTALQEVCQTNKRLIFRIG